MKFIAAVFGVVETVTIGYFSDIRVAIEYFKKHGCRIGEEGDNVEQLFANFGPRTSIEVYWSDKALESMGIGFYSTVTMLGSTHYPSGFDEDNPISLRIEEVQNRVFRGYYDD